MYLIDASFRPSVTWQNVLWELDHLGLFSRYVVVKIFVSRFHCTSSSIVSHVHVCLFLGKMLGNW